MGDPRSSARKKGSAHPTWPAASFSRAWLEPKLPANAMEIADYGIVNAVDVVLEIYRQPERAAGLRYGWKYGSVRLLGRSALVSPLAAPRARIRVGNLLPST